MTPGPDIANCPVGSRPNKPMAPFLLARCLHIWGLWSMATPLSDFYAHCVNLFLQRISLHVFELFIE